MPDILAPLNVAVSLVPRTARGVVTAATTDKTGATATNIVDVLTGAANGTRIAELVAKASGDLADSTILWFIHNGTDYRLFDEWDVGDPAAGSTTVVSYRESRTYPNLWLPSASFKIACGITVVPTAGNLVGWAFGGDVA